jgi:hypothetical protein
MRFEWDEWKNAKNYRKHGFSFEAAALVFADPHAVVFLERTEPEERWQIVGLAGSITVLFVVFTLREDNGDEIVRIISARKAAPQERQAYDQAYSKDS